MSVKFDEEKTQKKLMTANCIIRFEDLQRQTGFARDDVNESTLLGRKDLKESNHFPSQSLEVFDCDLSENEDRDDILRELQQVNNFNLRADRIQPKVVVSVHNC